MSHVIRAIQLGYPVLYLVTLQSNLFHWFLLSAWAQKVGGFSTLVLVFTYIYIFI